jgi:tetratricopeptide (TPR) repeat protein
MDPTWAATARFRRIDAVFDALLDLAPDEQMAYLDRAAGDDPELRGEVLQLLQAHRRSEGILEADTQNWASPLLGPSELLTLAGAPERIGAWRVIQAIGHGGMGAVFLGERADGQFEQRVAIKIIQYAAPGLVRRFLEERRILALLEHPSIARLIDGGLTPGGLPYFAMELVDGVHLDRYCKAHDLSIDRRLELLADVCDAVSYAHQHLVIHRDLKPSNILVTPVGRVKLLDFGIAKLLSDTSATERTETEFRAMTPEFAAPEQVRGEEVSTATDVYALGVLLYLLLTDQQPYDVRGKPIAELARIICEQAAPKPSTRVSQPLRRRLRGDLDLIALTALHKDPKRRYQTPTALADDLRRLRDGRPILARADTAGYRIRKFVGRHPAGVVLASSLVLLLAAAAGRERLLRQRAETEARKAKEVGDYIVSVFDVADPFAVERQNGKDVTARALLQQGARRVDSTLAGQPEVQAQLRSVFGRAYTSLGLFDPAVTLLRQALAQHQALYGQPNLTVAEDMERLGDALTQQDKFKEAEPLLREALAQKRLLGGSNEATAQTLDRLATLYQRRSEYAAAEPLFREALTIRRRLFGDTATVVGESLNNLGVLLFEKGEYDQAEPVYREAISNYLRRLGEDHPLTAEAMQNLAGTLDRRGKSAEAESLYRRALAAKRKTLGNAHPSVTINLNNLGELLITQNRLNEAEPLIREALALDRQIFGENHTYVAASLRNLGTVLKLKGEFAEAERYYREALAINRAMLGPENRATPVDLNNLGNLLRLENDLPGAVRYFREALRLARRVLGEDHFTTTVVTINLGRALQAQGNAVEAEQLLRAASSKLDTTNAAHRAWYVNAQSGLGLALVAQGRAADAKDLLERAVELARQQLGEEHVRTGDARLALGQALLATGEYAKAEPIVRAAAATFEKQRKSQPYFAAQASAALAELRRHRAD